MLFVKPFCGGKSRESGRPERGKSSSEGKMININTLQYTLGRIQRDELNGNSQGDDFSPPFLLSSFLQSGIPWL